MKLENSSREQRYKKWFRQYEEFKTTASEDELRYFEEFLKYKETNDPTFLTSSEAVDLRKKIGASKVREIEDLIKRKGWI